MKREGKQHGMVRTYLILPNPVPGTRFITRFDSPPTAGLFTRVSSKPTNHSKFTGKCCGSRCTGCRLHPVSKSKNKSKGNSKHLPFMDQPDSKMAGLSATGITDYYMDDDAEVEDENVDYIDEYVNNYSFTMDEKEMEIPLPIEQVIEEKYEDDHIDNYVNYSCIIDEKEMEISLPIEQVIEEKYEDEDEDEDEDWCLVERCY